MKIELKTNDTKPRVEYPLWDRDREPIDASELDAIKFSMQDKSGNAVITDDTTNTGVVTDKTSENEDGEEIQNWVYYEWTTGDTDTPGRYYAEFEVELDTDIMHFPKDAAANIVIQVDSEIG